MRVNAVGAFRNAQKIYPASESPAKSPVRHGVFLTLAMVAIGANAVLQTLDSTPIAHRLTALKWVVETIEIAQWTSSVSFMTDGAALKALEVPARTLTMSVKPLAATPAVATAVMVQTNAI